MPEMAVTPRRATFQAGLNNSDGAPSTPAWQSFESPRMPASGRASLGVPPFSTSRGSPSLSYPAPGYPNSPVVARSSASAGILQSPTPSDDGRFEPTPQHGIHARNLSIFFPHPGKSSADANKEDSEEAPETSSRDRERAPRGKRSVPGRRRVDIWQVQQTVCLDDSRTKGQAPRTSCELNAQVD